MKVVTVEEMRQIEELCAKVGLPPDVLMENAGKAVAEEVRHRLGNIEKQHIPVLVGPGNNGGDGLVAARYLKDWGATVNVYLLSERKEDDPNLKLVKERDISCIEAAGDENLAKLTEILSSSSAVIDAIFGTGRSRPLDGIFMHALTKVSYAQIDNPALHIFALDMPSGLDANTGEADAACLYVNDTITLGFPKVGLFNSDGAERAGQIIVADIDIPSYLAEQVQIELITADWALSALPERPFLANKGSFGRVLIVAGSNRFIGAAHLACMGAMRVGAGLVTLATPLRLRPIIAASLIEATYLPLAESHPGTVSPGAAKLVKQEIAKYDVLLMGCGMGQNRDTTGFIRNVLFGSGQVQLPLVLDADALNILAKIPEWWKKIPDDTIITPHPGEMSRLAGLTIAEIQTDRIATARKMAGEWEKTVVLKGAYSVIASPSGECRISPMANAGLASAGTGDVLAGVIAGLRAQGLAAANAAACGVYLHAEAGELVRERMGDTGMIASDLLPVLPVVIKHLKEEPLNGSPEEEEHAADS